MTITQGGENSKGATPAFSDYDKRANKETARRWSSVIKMKNYVLLRLSPRRRAVRATIETVASAPWSAAAGSGQLDSLREKVPRRE